MRSISVKSAAHSREASNPRADQIHVLSKLFAHTPEILTYRNLGPELCTLSHLE